MTWPWLRLLGGLAVWALHFLMLYAIGEWAGDRNAARIAVAAVTMVAVAVLATLSISIGSTAARDRFDRWWNHGAMALNALSVIAIVWQGLPAMF